MWFTSGTKLFGLGLFLWFTWFYPLTGQDPKCAGAACLAVSNVRHGTRCGARDSLELDVQNISTSLYLRGFVVFATPAGPFPERTGLLKHGEKVNLYVCHASGSYSLQANTGPDEGHSPYPSGKPQSGLVFCECDANPNDREHSCNVDKLNCNANVRARCELEAKSKGGRDTADYGKAYDACTAKGIESCALKQSGCLGLIRRCPISQVCSGCVCELPK